MNNLQPADILTLRFTPTAYFLSDRAWLAFFLPRKTYTDMLPGVFHLLIETGKVEQGNLDVESETHGPEVQRCPNSRKRCCQ